MTLISYPFYVLSFWYKDAVIGILKFYRDFNQYIVRLLSLPLMLQTFFKPLKNEYRSGLVGFSIGMGIFIKSCLILVDLLILLFFITIEIGVLLLFLVAPFVPLSLLFT